VALAPVNFEKPYTQKLEGVSTTVYKKTPPNLQGEARLAQGYPAITAAVVNTAQGGAVAEKAGWQTRPSH
jgi:hypothetical protein